MFALHGGGLILLLARNLEHQRPNGPFRSIGTCSEIRCGDVLIVVKLDRLGRNTRDVLNLVHELE
jgi:Resolvase, N terminal domain